ncbi:TetR/AcrR family transcriptional regulator [Streptomyces sp. NBC_01408]|uniref:TetR/AcrR family transcriptional regulator n=1 Tax=Streptomyces sp. NBC_01408 TaxID=2903855 RepID=UPI0022590A7C|nr:TetR/AcrR family transcriptional regulator [Streptomyces sp. NBC_01408]MCX4695892.1 TetR/AcrR family transcriptional regulator [Streptomyces sp. NBC_01408]
MSTAKGSARRAALLDAAEATLVGSGHAALSVRAVADAAGVRLGHLQYYFPTRDSLLEAVLDRLLRRSLDRLTEVAPGLAPDGSGEPVPPERLIGLLLAEQDNPELVRVFAELWALAARDEAVATAVRAFYRQYADLVTEQIRRHLPGLAQPELRARAEVFIALLEGSSLMRSGIAGNPSPATDALITRTALTLMTGPAAHHGLGA